MEGRVDGLLKMDGLLRVVLLTVYTEVGPLYIITCMNRFL